MFFYLNGSYKNKIRDSQKTLDNNIPKDKVGGKDNPNDSRNVAILRQDDYLSGTGHGSEYRSTSTKLDDLEWKQEFLTVNKKLEDLQTQIKDVKDEIDLKINQKSMSDWLNDQVIKI